MNLYALAAISPGTASTYEMVGWGITILCVVLVATSYLRGRSDLITAWNWLLFGVANNIGIGFLEATSRQRSDFEDWISYDFPNRDYVDLMWRNLFFVAVLFTLYYGVHFFRRTAQKRFMVSPAWSSTLVISVVVVSLVFIIGVNAVYIPVFSEVARNFSQKGLVFTGTFVFLAWYRNKASVPMLLIAGGIFVLAALFAIKISPGRRLLITLLVVPFVATYWMKWRYASRAKVLSLCVVGAIVVTTGALGYQMIRRFDTHGEKSQREERTYANIVRRIATIKFADISAQFPNWKHVLAQDNLAYGLLTKRVTDNGAAKPHYLNTLQFLVGYAVPRSLWSGKPQTLGIDLPRRYLGLPHKAVWGCGVAGHSYYEGGYLALVVYAAMLVVLVRLIDEPLKREPTNPFFIGTLVAASAYLVNTIRGDLGTNTAEVVECILFAILLNWTARVWCRSGRGAYGFSADFMGGFGAPTMSAQRNIR